MKGWPTVTVAIPAKNETANIPSVLDELPEGVSEVILVDGGSNDGTKEPALAARPDIRVINQAGSGKGDALRLGFAETRGEVIVTLDADGSADPREIPLLVAALLAGADFVRGSRYCVGGGSADLTPLRSLGNRSLGYAVNVMYRTSYTDLCDGYSAFWRSCLDALDLDCDGFEIEALMNIRAARSRLRVAEVPSYASPACTAGAT